MNEERLGRMEAKLDELLSCMHVLLQSLADEQVEDEQPELTLDGEHAGGERDAGTSLG